MAECYTISIKNGRPEFTEGAEIPEWALSREFKPGSVPAGVRLVCRMGDPDLMHCAVYRLAQGGIFSVHGRNNLLFAAIAPTNLAFGIAQGYFGELTANARYGVDVFENMEVPDD